jgi:hypothetical protein
MHCKCHLNILRVTKIGMHYLIACTCSVRVHPDSLRNVKTFYESPNLAWEIHSVLAMCALCIHASFHQFSPNKVGIFLMYGLIITLLTCDRRPVSHRRIRHRPPVCLRLLGWLPVCVRYSIGKIHKKSRIFPTSHSQKFTCSNTLDLSKTQIYYMILSTYIKQLNKFYMMPLVFWT